jgi:DNA-binding beta-propeller fold protein YncE
MASKEVLLVVQKGDHSLGYYDFETGEELARVPLDRYPHEFTLSPDGSRAYQCHFGVALAEDAGPGGNTVSIVDVAARRRIGSLDCAQYRRPHGIACDAAGALYVLSEGTGQLLFARDPASGRFDQAQPTGGKGSHIVSVTRDGRIAFSSNLFSGTVTALFPQDPERPPVAFPVGERPEGSVLDAQDERLYVVARESHHIAVIDVQRLALLEPIPTPPGPVRICWGPDGLLVVPLYHDQSLALVNPAGTVESVVALPGRPISAGYHGASGMALASTFGDRVCLVDARRGHFVRSIPTRMDPDPVAVVQA